MISFNLHFHFYVAVKYCDSFSIYSLLTYNFETSKICIFLKTILELGIFSRCLIFYYHIILSQTVKKLTPAILTWFLLISISICSGNSVLWLISIYFFSTTLKFQKYVYSWKQYLNCSYLKKYSISNETSGEEEAKLDFV